MKTILFRTLGSFDDKRHAIDIDGVVEEYEIPESTYELLWSNPNKEPHSITRHKMNINDWVMLS